MLAEEASFRNLGFKSSLPGLQMRSSFSSTKGQDSFDEFPTLKKTLFYKYSVFRDLEMQNNYTQKLEPFSHGEMKITHLQTPFA